ncbi:MAG: RNA methyltransferase [Deltaproteobacteria bacterium]|nr:RNA methyltransferase [Deltaproteobacteria bacterium]
MAANPLLANFAIVLSRPLIPENIGSAARVACNMGIPCLRVVSPTELDYERMLKMATHKAAHIIHEMKVYGDVREALSDFRFVVGLTARTGGERKPIMAPREVASRLFFYAAENSVALLFGSEDRGLTNEEIRLCHQLVRIPTAEFSSLNLAQAVMIMAYEIFLASFQECEQTSPMLATSAELELMYERVKDILIKINFIQPENPDHWMMNIRRFFSRLGLRSSDVNLIMGICRQVNWYSKARVQLRGEEKPETENGFIKDSSIIK